MYICGLTSQLLTSVSRDTSDREPVSEFGTAFSMGQNYQVSSSEIELLQNSAYFLSLLGYLVEKILFWEIYIPIILKFVISVLSQYLFINIWG